jgi:PAS domain S-box-containing protein
MVESVFQSHAEIVVSSSEKKLIRVLHVDDELGLLKVAKQCLELQGPFQVDTATSVEEALNKLKEKEYDAVVSDYQMPGKDGLEFLEMLRKNGNTIPFIMFTGKGREEVAVRAWSLGADHYVNKTGDPETVYCELAHCLRSTVEKHFAEAQIKEKVQKLQTIYQNAVEGISYVDAEENIVFANKAFADIIGYEQEQLAGMSLRKIVDDENWERIENETKRRRQEESSRYEAEFRRRDGTVRNVMISGAPLLDHDGRFAGTVGIVLDITERKKAEKETESMAKFPAEDPEPVLRISSDGTFLFANQASQNVLKESQSKKDRTLIVTLRRHAADALSSNEHSLFEEEHDGRILQFSVVPVASEGYANLYATDITERKQMEKQLKESEEKYRNLVENSQDAIAIVNFKGNVLFANKTAERLTGYTLKEGKGLNIRVVTPNRYWPKSVAMLLKARIGKPIPYFEYELKRKDGTIVPVETGGQAIFEDGKPVAIQIITREITERRKTEEALRQSEEKYRGLFENARDVIVLFDLKGNVTSINKAAEKYGFNRSGMLGKNMLKFVSKRYWPKLLKDVAQIALGKTAEGRIEIHTAKGDKIAEYRSNPIFSDNRVVGIQTILEDITEHKKTEEDLRESEGRYNALIESINDVFFAMDRDFRYTYWNKASERLTGISAKDAIGKSLTEVFPDVEGTEVEQFYQNTLRTNQHQTFVNKYRMGDRDFVFEINAYPTKDGLSVFVKDISERKKTEETLRESEEKYRNLFESAMDAIVTLDLKGSITAVNSSVLRFGYEKEDLVGKNILDFVSKEYWPAVMRDFSKVAQGEPAKNEVELVVSAGKILVEYHAGAIVKENNVAGVQINMRDVTERKKSEELLRESEERSRGLFESIQDPVGIFVGKEGHLIEYNAAFKKSSGYADEELKGKVFLDFVHPDDRAMVLEKYRTEYSEEELPLIYEIRGMNKKGESVPLELSVSTYKQKGKVIGIEVIHRDITERKKAEEALRETKEYLGNLLNYANAPVIVWDNEQKISLFNNAFEALTGYKKKSMLGRNIDVLFPPSQKTEILQTIERATQGEKWQSVEVPILCKNEETRIALWNSANIQDKDGNIVATIAQGQDITERKALEDALQNAKQKWTSLTENTHDIVMIVDSEGIIQYINRTIPPYTPEETIGKTVYEYVPREQHDTLRSSLKKTFEMGVPLSYVVSSNIPRIGTIWFETKIVPVKDD